MSNDIFGRRPTNLYKATTPFVLTSGWHKLVRICHVAISNGDLTIHEASALLGHVEFVTLCDAMREVHDAGLL